MTLAMPASRAELVAHYAAIRTRLDPQPVAAPAVGSAWHVDEGADDCRRIRAVLAIAAVMALDRPTPLTIGQIKQAVCRVYGITWQEIESPERGRFVTPRHVAMTLARRMTNHSLPEIGRRFGGRDHSTVRHAVRKWEAAVAGALGEGE
jgi:DnaA-like protein